MYHLPKIHVVFEHIKSCISEREHVHFDNMYVKCADNMANSENPDQIAPSVCPGST